MARGYGQEGLRFIGYRTTGCVAAVAVQPRKQARPRYARYEITLDPSMDRGIQIGALDTSHGSSRQGALTCQSRSGPARACGKQRMKGESE